MGLTKAQAAGLADTSVSAGSYGSATAIPAITVVLPDPLEIANV